MNWWAWAWTDAGWERVAGPCPSLPACSDQLSKIARQRGIPAKLCCMTGGGAPRFTPRTEKGTVAHEHAL
jgi:hypothetical protein